jgi:hypothetical protein
MVFIIAAPPPQHTLPPTPPPFSLSLLGANLPTSVLPRNPSQHSKGCHLATDRRLWHMKQNKKPVQKEKNNVQWGFCEWQSLTCRAQVVSEEAQNHFLPPLCPWPGKECSQDAFVPFSSSSNAGLLFHTQNLCTSLVSLVKDTWGEVAVATFWGPQDFLPKHDACFFPLFKSHHNKNVQ